MEARCAQSVGEDPQYPTPSWNARYKERGEEHDLRASEILMPKRIPLDHFIGKILMHMKRIELSQ